MRKLCVLALIFLAGIGAVSAADPALGFLLAAIKDRKIDTVTGMLAANPKLVNEVDGAGATPTHYAASGDREILRVVLRAQPDVNLRDQAGRTPIFGACEWTQIDNLRLLIAAGAEVNLADNLGETPLMIVCDKGKPDMAQILLMARAEVNAANKNGATPLMFAAARGNEKLSMMLIIDGGAKIDARDKDGNTALHYAARNDQRDVVKLFGAIINEKNNAGQTAMNVAGLGGYTKTVQELLKFGAVN